MPNRILDAYVATHRADPADAELRVLVRSERLTAATQVRGRLMGPRSPYAQTVEIAYPVRELARTDHVLLRVRIPEPNFWEPKTPLLYEGPLELWEGDERCDQIVLRHGIRVVQFGERGLRLNGKALALQGVACQSFTEADARRWHAEGINLVMIPARDDIMDLWKLSDRFGLLMLGRIDAPHQWPRWAQASQRYPSFLGCVTAPAVSIDSSQAPPGCLLGAEIGEAGKAAAGRYDFLVAPAGKQIESAGPTLVMLGMHKAPSPGGNVLGWVRAG